MWRYCLVVVLFCMALFLDPEGATRERCRGTTFNCVVNRKVVHWCVLKKKHNTEICRKCSVQFMLKECLPISECQRWLFNTVKKAVKYRKITLLA